MAQPNSSYHATQQLGELQTEPLTSGAAPSSSHQPAVAMPAPRPQQRQHDFQVVKETQLHRRYLSVLNRTVRFTDDRGEVTDIDYDVVGHPQAHFKFAAVFPFHPYHDGRPGGEVTVIREYGQGPNCLVLGLPAGGFDPSRHLSHLECAQAELSQEARLCGGEWVQLLPEGHPGLAEVKWCVNRFMPFLVIDPQPDPSPESRDEEEHTLQVLRMPLEEFELQMVSGDMMLPSITTAYMAIRELQKRGRL